ncbi:MAG: twin-arginine translocase subunit TatC [Haloarculaceae archaeon]
MPDEGNDEPDGDEWPDSPVASDASIPSGPSDGDSAAPSEDDGPETPSDGVAASEESGDSSERRSDGGEAFEDVDPYGPGPPAGTEVGAPDDQEMPLDQHIEEMVRRLGVVIVVAALVSGVVFPFAEYLINFLWYSFLPGSVEVCPVPPEGNDAACPRVFHPLALMFARLKVATLAGFIAALPVAVYESYLFMKPGLYPQERRYYLASVPTSLVLAFVGVGFAYLLVLPAMFIYFTGYTEQAAEVAFSLTETFNLIVMMLGFFALIFQIPLLIMLAVMMGVTTRRWMADRRLYFYGGFATVAFVFSPDPTGMAPILVAVTMIVLFEGTLLVLLWTRESSPLPSAEALRDRRPVAWALALFAGYLASSAPVPPGYYDSLPPVVTDYLASAGLTTQTPLIIGLVIGGLYELAAYSARSNDASARVRRAFSRGRALVWPLAFVVGYFGSPNPTLVTRVSELALPARQVAVLVVGLVAAFELFVVVRDWREGSAVDEVEDYEEP